MFSKKKSSRTQLCRVQGHLCICNGRCEGVLFQDARALGLLDRPLASLELYQRDAGAARPLSASTTSAARERSATRAPPSTPSTSTTAGA